MYYLVILFYGAGIKALILCSLGFSTQLAFSETSLTGNANPVQKEQSIWWSKSHSSCELFIEEQVLNQLGLLTLLNLAPLNRKEIIAKLREDFNISIGADSPSLFSKYFLAYIYNYFKVMFPQKTSFSPLYLYALSKDSPQLVNIEGSHIYFSKNAGDKVINNTIRELLDDYCESQSRPEEITMTFEYNNDFYDQLNRAFLTNQDIMNFIETQMNVTLEVDKTDPLYKDTQAFDREELLILLKQILDMPSHLRGNLALKRILRMQPDYQPPYYISEHHDIAASYHSDTQTIHITDIVFTSLNESALDKEGDNDSYGEKIILHEMAHALWYGLPPPVQKEYESLSWDGNTEFIDEFISAYARTHIEEDFAEHVIFYMENSEKLKHPTPRKFHWLKQHIFLNVEYVTDSADNIKTVITSESEDISPPYFVNPLEESVTFSVERISLDKMQLTTEIEGFFDDISGIKDIRIFLRSAKGAQSIWRDSLYIGKNFNDQNPCPISPTSCVDDNKLSEQDSLFAWKDFFNDPNRCPPSPTSCVTTDGNKPGWYILQHIIDLNAIRHGHYNISFIFVEDYAGNKKTFWNHLGNQTSYFPGTKKPASLENSPQQIITDKINREAVARTLQANTEIVTASKTPQQDTLAYIIIPESSYTGFDRISSYFEAIRIYFKGSRTGKKFNVTVDMDTLPYLHSRFSSPQIPGTITLPIVIPKEFSTEKYELSHIYLIKDISPLQYLGVRMNGFYVDHASTEEDKTSPRIKTQDIVLKVLTGLNKKGGNISVLATLPVEGFDAGKKIYVIVTMRTPAGKILYNQIWGIQGEVLTRGENESFYISTQFDLKPHPAEGEYTLSAIYLTEYPAIGDQEVSIIGADQQTGERLIERNIKATVQIEASP